MWISIAVGLGIAVFAYFVAVGRKLGRSDRMADSTLSRAPQAAPAPQEEGAVLAALLVLERVAEENSAAERRVAEELSAHRAKSSTAIAVLKKTGLWIAVPELFQLIRHWPSWQAKPSWSCPLQIGQLTGGTERPGADAAKSSTWVAWQWSEMEFRLALHDRGLGYEGSTAFGTIRLEADGVTVLDLLVSKDLAEEFSDWRALGVDAFTVGAWMAPFSEFAARARAVDAGDVAKLSLNRERERAQRIDLGD